MQVLPALLHGSLENQTSKLRCEGQNSRRAKTINCDILGKSRHFVGSQNDEIHPLNMVDSGIFPTKIGNMNRERSPCQALYFLDKRLLLYM